MNGMGGGSPDQILQDKCQKVQQEQAGGAAGAQQAAGMMNPQAMNGMGGPQAQGPQAVQGVGATQGAQNMGMGGQVASGPQAAQQGQQGQQGQATGSPAVQDLMQTYQGYKQQEVQLQPQTEQLVQKTLMGAGVQLPQTGQQQGGQGNDQMVNQLNGMMDQFNNLTGGQGQKTQWG